MNTQNKLIVIGRQRHEMLRYMGEIDGDYVFVFEGQVLGYDCTTADHSKKRHFIFWSHEPVTDAMVKLMAKHPEFRFIYYYKNESGHGMFVSKHGHVVVERIKENA